MYKKIFYTLITTVSLFAGSANGAPMAYSVNSDGQKATTWDSLYLIDLAVDGSEQRRGFLSSGGVYEHFDTEGLAFAPDGTLWGVDENSRILFSINTLTGSVNPGGVIPFYFLPPLSNVPGSRNDFGMTFTCDGSLYLTSVATNMLFRVDLEARSSQEIGNLGVNISAIAAIGNPARLYGLGNGLLENGGVDSPNLYTIDTGTGKATKIGPLTNALPYNEAGLAFDSEGHLWAITDRSGLNNQPSQVLSIDVATGLATVASTTIETGFESLAIAPPAGCYSEVLRGYVDPFHRIPTLGPGGLLLATFALMLAGMIFLRRRFS